MTDGCPSCKHFQWEVTDETGPLYHTRKCSVAITPKVEMVEDPNETWKYCDKYVRRENEHEGDRVPNS
jgi:hypothetical protein